MLECARAKLQTLAPTARGRSHTGEHPWFLFASGHLRKARGLVRPSTPQPLRAARPAPRHGGPGSRSEPSESAARPSMLAFFPVCTSSMPMHEVHHASTTPPRVFPKSFFSWIAPSRQRLPRVRCGRTSRGAPPPRTAKQRERPPLTPAASTSQLLSYTGECSFVSLGR